MDITPPACSICKYRLPMTWTKKTEMLEMMMAAGWLFEPTVCPPCRRKLWLERNKRKVSAYLADSRS